MKGHEIVESHGLQRLEGTQHIKNDHGILIFILTTYRVIFNLAYRPAFETKFLCKPSATRIFIYKYIQKI